MGELLLKRVVVLVLVEETDGYVMFERDEDGVEQILLDPTTWAEMGSPQCVTITIEPDDTLNEGDDDNPSVEG